MRRDGERLADIIEAAEKISIRAGKGRQAFDADEDVQIVLVHLIQVIGEAASGSPRSSARISPCCWERRMGKRAGAGCLPTVRRILFSLRILSLGPVL